MKLFLSILLISFSAFAQFPPKPGGGGPKPPSFKKPELPKPDISGQVQKAISSNLKQLQNLDKQFLGMKKKLLEGNKKQLTQFLDVAKKMGNKQLSQMLNKNLKMISSQLSNLTSGGSSESSSSDSSSDEESDEEDENSEESESEEKSSEESSGDSAKSNFPEGRWYQTKSHFTLQSGGEGIDSNGDRFSWTQKGNKITIQYNGKVVRVYIDTEKREILGLDRQRTRGVYEGN